jgi:hypothetical protein
MQIELAPEVEKVIVARAEATGLTPEEVANQFLASLGSPVKDAESRFKSFEEARAWMLSRNPSPLPEHSPDIDWQALKAEGRRY